MLDDKNSRLKSEILELAILCQPGKPWSHVTCNLVPGERDRPPAYEGPCPDGYICSVWQRTDKFGKYEWQYAVEADTELAALIRCRKYLINCARARMNLVEHCHGPGATEADRISKELARLAGEAR